MKYYLTTKSNNDGSYTRTFANVGELNEAVVVCINAGYKESDKALSNCYLGSNEVKYYAIVQGIQLATMINSVEMG